MKLSLPKKKGVSVIKESRELHSRKYWTYLLTFFVLAIAGELGYFSWYFLHVSRVLEAPANPTLETNAAKIKSMERDLDLVEKNLKARVGESESSQNTTSVIQ